MLELRYMKSNYIKTENGHIFYFEIKGNQEKKDGNPIGYKRANRGSSWTPEIKRYHAWCNYVRKCFSNIEGLPKEFKNTLKNPIDISKSYASLDLEIDFASEVRGDVDNILKGIADSLFINDKNMLIIGAVAKLRQPSGLIKITIETWNQPKNSKTSSKSAKK